MIGAGSVEEILSIKQVDSVLFGMGISWLTAGAKAQQMTSYKIFYAQAVMLPVLLDTIAGAVCETPFHVHSPGCHF